METRMKRPPFKRRELKIVSLCVFKINFEMINSKVHFEPKNDSH